MKTGFPGIAACVLSLQLFSNELIKDPSFEENSGKWPLPRGYRIEPHAGRNGSAGLVYRRTDPKEYPLPQMIIRLEAGRSYEFKVWIRVENIKGQGASACLEYASLKGKYLGGLYLKNVNDNSGKWHELSGSFTVPENAVCKVTPYLRPGSTGTAYFDDFSLKPKEDRYIIYAASDHNRVSEDGSIAFRVFRNDKPVPAKEKMVCRLQLGNTVLKKTLSGDTVHFTVPGTFSGKSDVRIALVNSKGRTQYETVLPITRRTSSSLKGQCEISEDGIAVIDGKRFMPLGFYGLVDDRNVALAHSAGANTFLSYTIIWGQYKNFRGVEGIRKMLDLLENNKMKLLFSIKDHYSEKKSWNGIQGGDAIVRKLVETFREHPALLGWYICDEMPASMQEKLIQRRRMVNELDPRHPTFAVFYQFSELKGYAPGLDVLGVDPYPVKGAAPEKTDMTLVEFAMEQARKTGKPVWAVPQIFDNRVYLNSGRAPTEQEMRSMSFLMAGLGAKGFIYYMLDDLRSPKLPADNFDVMWPQVRSVVKTMKQLEPFIISGIPIEEIPVGIQKGKVRAFRLTAEDGNSVILICSIESGKSQASWKLSGSWRSLYGKTRFGRGSAEFRGESIDSDLLMEKE